VRGVARLAPAARRYTPEVDASAATKADQELDGAWSGLHGLLVGSTKLTATAEGVERGARARAVIDRVFPQGLRFLKLPHREQWAESQKKLDRLAEPDIAEHIEALGGGPFVRAIVAAYTNYGVVLHLTRRKAGAKAQVKVREPLERVLDAVRRYVVHVAAYLDEHEGDPEAQAMCRGLLEPLATWKSSGGGRKAPAPEAPDGDEPGEGSGEGPGEGRASRRRRGAKAVARAAPLAGGRVTSSSRAPRRAARAWARPAARAGPGAPRRAGAAGCRPRSEPTRSAGCRCRT
jgi:hypothetical protein